MIEATWKSFHELTPLELYHLLWLRVDVFMLEQDCLYQEVDGKDIDAMHLLLKEDSTLVGYARVLFDEEKNALSFGRLVSHRDKRGSGIGKNMMDEIMGHFKSHHPKTPVIISAQTYLESFYQRYGFISEGEPYLEDELPHIMMTHIGISDD